MLRATLPTALAAESRAELQCKSPASAANVESSSTQRSKNSRPIVSFAFLGGGFSWPQTLTQPGNAEDIPEKGPTPRPPTASHNLLALLLNIALPSLVLCPTCPPYLSPLSLLIQPTSELRAPLLPTHLFQDSQSLQR
eukprot:9466322-Pyramimonas_sp.AAC.2